MPLQSSIKHQQMKKARLQHHPSCEVQIREHPTPHQQSLWWGPCISRRAEASRTLLFPSLAHFLPLSILSVTKGAATELPQTSREKTPLTVPFLMPLSNHVQGQEKIALLQEFLVRQHYKLGFMRNPLLYHDHSVLGAGQISFLLLKSYSPGGKGGHRDLSLNAERDMIKPLQSKSFACLSVYYLSVQWPSLPQVYNCAFI